MLTSVVVNWSLTKSRSCSTYPKFFFADSMFLTINSWASSNVNSSITFAPSHRHTLSVGGIIALAKTCSESKNWVSKSWLLFFSICNFSIISKDLSSSGIWLLSFLLLFAKLCSMNLYLLWFSSNFFSTISTGPSFSGNAMNASTSSYRGKIRCYMVSTKLSSHPGNAQVRILISKSTRLHEARMLRHRLNSVDNRTN